MFSLNSSSFLQSLANKSEQPSFESFTDSKLHIISEELPFTSLTPLLISACYFFKILLLYEA